jgi:hypothetical protein
MISHKPCLIFSAPEVYDNAEQGAISRSEGAFVKIGLAKNARPLRKGRPTATTISVSDPHLVSWSEDMSPSHYRRYDTFEFQKFVPFLLDVSEVR